MATTDDPQTQIDILGKSLVASRAEFKETSKLLKAAQAHIVQLEALGPVPSGETVKAFVDSSIVAGVASASNELVQRCAALETELATAKTAATDINDKFAASQVANEIREAARASFVKPEALGDAIAIGNAELHMVDGVVVTDDGSTAAEWFEQRKSVSGYWWPAARGAGARGSAEMAGATLDNPFVKGASFSVTRQSQIAAGNPGLAERLRGEANASMANM
jgi:hypothetical protein